MLAPVTTLAGNEENHPSSCWPAATAAVSVVSINKSLLEK